MTDTAPPSTPPSPRRRPVVRRPMRLVLGLAAPLFVGLAPPGPVRSAPPEAPPPVPGRVEGLPTPETPEMVIHLLQRATFGPRPEDISEVLDVGMEAWLDMQMGRPEERDPHLAERLARHPGAFLSPGESWAVHAPRGDVAELAALRERRQAGDSLTAQERERLRTALASGPGRLVLDLQAARLHRAVHSTRQLEEMMVGFWTDHFNVFAGKGQVRYQVADYEARAIRPHVFGRFEDMLQAVASHPAMLLYLDNARNAAPDTTLFRGRRRPEGRPLPGINENYARELLELHTLGVDGGYTEADVQEVARVFTGWGVVPPEPRNGAAAGRAFRPQGEPWSFVFRPRLHDSHRRTVMEWTLEEGGEAQGRELLTLLGRHPSTARNVANALATRFVADDPPPALVDHVAAVFLESDGDLGRVTKALFLSPWFHAPEVRGNRIRSPFLLAAAALRLTGAEVQDPRGILEHLRTMGESPYGAEPPTGYPQGSGEWGSSGALVARIDFLTRLAEGGVRGVHLLPSSPLGAMDGEDPVRALEGLLLPGTEAPPQGAPPLQAAPGPPSTPDLRDALALVLASPAFQTH